MKIPKIILAIIPVIAIVFMTGGIISYYLKDQQVQTDTKRRTALNEQILDGVSTKPTEMIINYAKPTATGSPLIFGGSHMPPVEHQDAWNQLQEVGVTSVREDLAMNWMVRNTTLEDYKNDVNDIQNIDKWNTVDLKNINRKFLEAKKRGIKTIGIVDYIPPWLGANSTEFGVPKDWGVFEDLVKKTYSYHRNALDYVEIWNEPNWTPFLVVTNSGMDRQSAYAQIYYHAAKAIREVDKEANDGKVIPIGGPANSEPRGTSLLETVIQNKETRSMLNFASYHNYDTPEPSWANYKALLKKYHMDNFPLFITEWNIDGENGKNNPNKTSDQAILFTGNKLVDFLKMGLTGANYFSLQQIKDGSQYLGFYRWKNGKAELLPQGKSWRLLSKQMGLGNGKSYIYSPEKNYMDFNSLGFTNAAGNDGIVIINNNTSGSLINVQLQNLHKGNYLKASVYFASASNDTKKPVYEGLVKGDGQSFQFSYFVPAETIMGVVFTPDKEWFDVSNILH